MGNTEIMERLHPYSLNSVSSVFSVVFKNLFRTYFGIDALVSSKLPSSK